MPVTKHLFDLSQIGWNTKNPEANDLSIRGMRDAIRTLEARFDITGAHFQIGDPGAEPPIELLEATAAATLAGHGKKYEDFIGIPELRAAASRYFNSTITNTSIDVAHTMAAVGTMNGMFKTLSAIARRDKRKSALMLCPAFPPTFEQLNRIHINAERLDTSQLRGYELGETINQRLETNPKISTIIYSDPANPSGRVFTETELKSIADATEAHNVYIISDDAYFGIVFNGNVHHIGEYTEHYAAVSSCSKIFSYPGGRTGWVFVGQELLEMAWPNLKKSYVKTANTIWKAMSRDTYTGTVGPNVPAQHGVATMLNHEVEHNFGYRKMLINLYGNRANATRAIFEYHGFETIAEPKGGMFLTVRHPDYDSGAQLAVDLLGHGIGSSFLKPFASAIPGVRLSVAGATNEMLDLTDGYLSSFERHLAPA